MFEFAEGGRSHESALQTLRRGRHPKGWIRSSIVRTKEPAMSLLRVQLSVLGVGAAVLLLTSSNIDIRVHAQPRTTAPNPITGEGLPNPAPIVTRNWGQLPAGRKWGTTAGIDIDPTDGNVWAYERCGS